MKNIKSSKRKHRTMTNEELADRLTSVEKHVSQEAGSGQTAELRDLLHELEVSQIELEVQNNELNRSRRSLEESHDKYLSLYDFAPIGYLTLDKIGTVLELNLTAVDLFGVERQRMIGRLLSTKIQRSDLQKFREHLLHCRDGEKKVSDRIHLINADQTLRAIQLSTLAVRDRDSGTLTFRTAITDLTEQLQAESERERLLNQLELSRKQLQDFFMQAPSPLAILEGSQHKYVLANPHYEKMIGRKALGKTVQEVFPDGEVISLIPSLDSVYNTGLPYAGKELPLDLPDENGILIKRWIDFAYYPFCSERGEITGVMAIHHDVTEAVLTRQQLEFARQEAEKTTNLKSTFLANMSHEIRTPLGAILGFAEIMIDSDSQAEREKYGIIVIRNGKALTKIIDDILDLSKVEAGKLEIERIEFDVKELVNEIASLFHEATINKNIELKAAVHPSMPEMVNSDPTRIRQILINLIGNAVKFTTKGSISIYAEPQFLNDSLTEIKFTIQDTGIGISSDQIEKIFAPFAQADCSTTRKFGGSGLGLDLSRRLARALGGDVKILETENRNGCTFLASVGARNADHRSQAIAAENYKVRPMPDHDISRVLLVEDSIDNQRLVKLFLNRAGIKVDVANNGAEGVEMAENNDYDVVLMDMQMPILDGYAATLQLRNDGYIKPIIALTAHAMLEDRSRILELGCDAYLTKPINARLLIETLDRVKTGTH